MRNIMWLGLLCASGISLADNLLDLLPSSERPAGDLPSWLAPLQGQSAQIPKIDADLNSYVEHKYGSYKPLADQTDEWLQGVEPWVRAYKSWKKAALYLTDSEGQVHLRPSSQTQSSKTPPPAVDAAQWKVLGPVESFYPVNHDSQQRPNPWIANIYRMKASPSNPSVVYAGGETGHLYKTTNKGLLWTDISYNYAFGGFSALGVHPTNENIVYVGSGSWIHRSEDGGLTWTRPLNVSSLNPNKFAIYPSGSTYVVLAATGKGIYRSPDGGSTWSQITTPLCYDITLNPLNSQVAYAVCKVDSTVRIYKSTDGGLSFVNRSVGFDTTHANNGALVAMSPADTNFVYAGFLGSSSNTVAESIQLLRSVDGANTWTVQKTCDLKPGDLSSFLNWQGFYNFALAVNPNQVGQVILGTANAHKSLDSGKTMSTIGGFGGPVPLHPDFQDISVVGNDTWIATDGGLTYSSDFFTDRNNAQARNKGITGSDFWHFDQGWDQDLIVGGRYHNGNAILSENIGKDTALRFGGAESGTGWVLHGKHGAILTDDAGSAVISDQFNGSMQYFNYSKYPGSDGYGSMSSNLLIDPTQYNHHFVGNDSTLWESKDAGLNFTALKKFPGKVRKMALGRPSGKELYVLVQGQNVLNRSLDGGSNWTELALPSGVSAQNVLIAVNPANASELWIVNRSGANGAKVYSSEDGGSTWTNRTTAVLDGKALNEISYVPGSPDHIYVYAHLSLTLNQLSTKQIQVYHMSKGSGLWESYSQGLPTASHVMGRALPFFRDAKLRMSTNHGIWESPMVDTLIRPVAQPSVPLKNVQCGRDTLELFDYSVAFKPKSRVWEIIPAPQYVTSLNVARPKIVLGSSGSYRVKLKVTDGHGSVDSLALDSALEVPLNSACDLNTTTSGSLLLSGNPQYATLAAPGINSNSLTWMAWIKLDTTQNPYTGIIYSRHSGEGRGLIFKDSNALGFDWNGGWGNSSTARVPKGVWSHVALTVAPDTIKVYLNGNVVLAKKGTYAAADFMSSLYLGRDPNNSSRYMKGLIDEVQLWNRTLSGTEIQGLMNYYADPKANGLAHYYQMSEMNSTQIYDGVGVGHGQMSASRSAENAPVIRKDGVVDVLKPVLPKMDLTYSWSGTRLKLSQKSEGILKVQIFDLQGQLLKTQQVRSQTLQMDLQGLGAGPKMIRMMNDHQILHRIWIQP